MGQRTPYPKLFKAQIVQERLEPGVSMASVALPRHQRQPCPKVDICHVFDDHDRMVDQISGKRSVRFGSRLCENPNGSLNNANVREIF